MLEGSGLSADGGGSFAFGAGDGGSVAIVGLPLTEKPLQPGAPDTLPLIVLPDNEPLRLTGT
jgi:hypothetical protein